jgi:hypothetical protein
MKANLRICQQIEKNDETIKLSIRAVPTGLQFATRNYLGALKQEFRLHNVSVA